MRWVKCGEQIDRDDCFPLFSRKIADGRCVLDPGIIHQNVDATQFFGRLSNHGRNFGSLAHISAAIGDPDLILICNLSTDPLDHVPLTESIDENVCAAPATARAIPRPIPDVELVTTPTLPVKDITVLRRSVLNNFTAKKRTRSDRDLLCKRVRKPVRRLG